MAARPIRRTFESVGRRLGFKSGLERRIAEQLDAAGVPVKYEEVTLEYSWPARKARYTPDWVLPNGIVVESKGRFMAEDRQKHLLVKQQHPELDIRFVFSNSRAPIYKGSPTSYADWCTKNGFQYADRLIPKEWLK